MGLDSSGMRDHGAGGAARLGNLGDGKGESDWLFAMEQW